ncbi:MULTISPECIES: copper resistance protein B [unclassified Sphingopyxis]|uniref:copper resistance protein B n=1 Tax=unclassified Sphingopyxis TaxID=2614943 RepID=UPI00073696A1|nr:MULTISPECIES: copper resistance protein B [unclassified Sphingopyxis]KTE39760.1 copper resistance protein CopB [Sphingopyxis sp. HIX]KTE84881.1 copper resistance protein CopB [Sphingopyxis sp. HXXIV]
MMRAALLLAGLSTLALGAPAAAQSGHAGHGGTQSAPMPMPEKPAPAGDGDHGQMEMPAGASCAPEHAAMGHCTPDAEAAAPDDAPACPPEHAAMGHCAPAIAPPTMPAPSATGMVGTDLPAGDAPAPPPPGDWYADRLYPKSEMEHSRHAMMLENGAQTTAFLSFNLAEYQVRKGRDGYRWDAEGWYGGDINRVTVKSEGEGSFGEAIESIETQLLYSRPVDAYFNLQAGIRQDLGHGPGRTYATVGFEGLAPYWFEVEGALFVSDKGDVSARIEGYYDQRITQQLILQPMAELNVAAQDVPELGVGSGLSDMELGLRLRYEIVREFAPYVGVEWARKFGDTARFARAAGEDASSVSLVMGLRAWF